MSEELLVRHCSPTLAGIKTGSLFTCAYATPDELRAAMRYWNRRLGSRGLRVLPLRYRHGRALIYVYRPRHLARDLQREEALRLLRARGYHTETGDRCLVDLIRRLSEGTEFPHEIGLFLSYPPEDVCGFIENRAGGYKTVGCWKVYGDEQAARQTFEQYDRCTALFQAQWAGGRSIERLTTAV